MKEMIKIENMNIITSKWKIVIENIYITILLILSKITNDVPNTFKISILLLSSNLYVELFVYFMIWKIYTPYIGRKFNEVDQFIEWKSKQYIFCIKECIIISKYILYIITFFLIVTSDGMFSSTTTKYLFITYLFLVFMNLLYVIFSCIYCKFSEATFEITEEINDIKYYSEEECCICLDKNIEKEWKILQCAHKFHSECIDNWTNINNTCPICRD